MRWPELQDAVLNRLFARTGAVARASVVGAEWSRWATRKPHGNRWKALEVHGHIIDSLILPRILDDITQAGVDTSASCWPATRWQRMTCIRLYSGTAWQWASWP